MDEGFKFRREMVHWAPVIVKIGDEKSEEELKIEYNDFLDSLSKLNESGISTNEIIKILSLNDVKCGIRVFRIIELILEKEKKHNLVPISAYDITRAAKKLKVSVNDLLDCFMQYPKIGIRIFQESPKIEGVKAKGYAERILVAYLFKHLTGKKVSNDQSYSFINKFLVEQKIRKNMRNKSNVRRQIERLIEDELRVIYNYFYTMFQRNIDESIWRQFIKGQLACRRIAVDNPKYFIGDTIYSPRTRDVVFPIWEDFWF